MRTKQTHSLKELRKAKGLTLQELSEQTGIKLPTLQALESGRGTGFKDHFKITLSDFFQVPLKHLFPEIQQEINRLQELLNYKPKKD